MAALASCGPDSMTFSSNSSSSRRERGEPLGDLGVEAAVVAASSAQLEQHRRDPRPSPLSSVTRATRARQLGALADQLLRAAIVLPERRRGHLGCRARRAAAPCRDVKDASGARRRDPTRSSMSRLSSPSIRRLRLHAREREQRARDRERQRTPASRRSACTACAASRSGTRSVDVVRSYSGRRRTIWPRGRDEGRDAGVRRADHRDAVLDGTERIHGEMLQRAARAAEPSVIRHVHHQTCAIPSRTRGPARGRCPRSRSRPRTGLADPGRRRALEPGSSSAMNSAQPLTNPITPDSGTYSPNGTSWILS